MLGPRTTNQFPRQRTMYAHRDGPGRPVRPDFCAARSQSPGGTRWSVSVGIRTSSGEQVAGHVSPAASVAACNVHCVLGASRVWGTSARTQKGTARLLARSEAAWTGIKQNLSAPWLSTAALHPTRTPLVSRSYARLRVLARLWTLYVLDVVQILDAHPEPPRR